MLLGKIRFTRFEDLLHHITERPALIVLRKHGVPLSLHGDFRVLFRVLPTQVLIKLLTFSLRSSQTLSLRLKSGFG